jgi:hypothetical protein
MLRKEILDATQSGNLLQIRDVLERWSATHNCGVRSRAKP